MAEVEHVSLDALTARLDEVENYLHIDEKREEIASLTQISAKADFWNDADFARQTMARLASLKDDVAGIDAADEDAPAAAVAPADVAEPAADSAVAPVEEAIATELAEATAVENATDDSEVTDVPDDWNMINVPRPKPVR